MQSSAWLPWGVAVVVFGGLILAVEVGYQLGRRRRLREGERAELGVVQGAVLGLLGLLLGFSFAGAAGRFVERQDLLVREANAIGTAYLRADLIGDPQRVEIKRMLRDYTRLRVLGGRERDAAKQAEMIASCEAMHERMWAAAAAGVRERPAAMNTVVPAINDVIDLHTLRLTAAERHLPLPVLVLLLSCAAVSLWMVGHTFGLDQRRNLGLAGTLAFVVASAIWFTIDLDYPRRGLIRLNDRALEGLKFPGLDADGK